MLCSKCSNIHFRTIEHCDELVRDEMSGRNCASDHEVYYLHHADHDALSRSSRSGCHFCVKLLDRFVGECRASQHYDFDAPEPFSDYSTSPIIMHRRLTWKPDSSLETWNRSELIAVKCGPLECAAVIDKDKYGNFTKGMLRALAEPQSLRPCDLHGNFDPNTFSHQLAHQVRHDEKLGDDIVEIDALNFICFPSNDDSTMSSSNMQLAAYWLRSCIERHEACKELETKGPLPYRIIDISNPQCPVLTFGANRYEPYIALSYKWGQIQRYMTTTQNVTEHTTSGIPLNRLPRTFRDAIFVANSLRFQWLWIDALCICQDNPLEKSRQIRNMDLIFQWSTLTIFATAGNDAEHGLKSQRDPRWLKPCELFLKTTVENQSTEASAIVALCDGEETSKILYSRGWVLQEQILSQRALMFEDRQIRWRCLGGDASEWGPEHANSASLQVLVKGHTRGMDEFNSMRLWMQHTNPMLDLIRCHRYNHYDAWYTMITEYSTRILTYEADVLSALAGIERGIARTHGCTYYAGLWKEDLQTGLGWFVKNASHDGDGTNDAALPSWSWIARRGHRIEFLRTGIIESPGQDIVNPDEGISGPEFDTRQFPDQTSLTPFTLIHLRLTGKLRQLEVDPISSGDESEGFQNWLKQYSMNMGLFHTAPWQARVRDITTKENLGHINFDFEPTSAGIWRNPRIYCLLCIVYRNHGNRLLACLGLVPADDTLKKFRRVGMIILHKPSWFGLPRNIETKENESSGGEENRATWEEITSFRETITIV